MKTKIMKFCGCLVVAIAALGIYDAYDSSMKENTSALLMANVEALSDPEDTRDYPMYKNVNWKRSYIEFKTEVEIKNNPDSTKSTTINVNYKRDCSSVLTYCQYTGNKSDICYGSLNGVMTDCTQWMRQ